MRGDKAHSVYVDAVYDRITDPNFEDIQKLNTKIFNCRRDIYLFTDYIRFRKGDVTKWSNLITQNEGMIKEFKIRIALLGG